MLFYTLGSCKAAEDFRIAELNGTEDTAGPDPLFITPPTLAPWTSLHVEGGVLNFGKYIFKAVVFRKNESEEVRRHGKSSWLVEVTKGAPPPIQITVPWEMLGRVSTQTGLTVAGTSASSLAQVQGGKGCPVPATWAWRWLLVEQRAPSKVLKSLATTTERNDIDITMQVFTSEFSGSLLEPGMSYAYALILTTSTQAMLSLEKMGMTDLTTIAFHGATVVRTIPFLADAPPSGGLVKSVPMVGEAVNTAFTMSTDGWYDDTNGHDLTYAFYRFPLPAGVKLEENITSGGFDVTGNFRVPEIDFSDSQSPSYWVKQRGLMLRPWDKSKAVPGLSMSTGSYYIIGSLVAVSVIFYLIVLVFIIILLMFYLCYFYFEP
ncbi:unnamed protein product [Polarella glacialis]|uniref:PKD/REJ-like domain-containing protein n=1 Tax=Polarella glacialis TaxID=89957 RepID=A0A813JDG6_POLGL|nr:unnamed protein product [Polarella glacialis]